VRAGTWKRRWASTVDLGDRPGQANALTSWGDLQAGVDLAAQLRVGEVVAGEDGPHYPAEFLQREVDRLLGAALREAAQHLVGLGGPQPQRGRVLDHLVVVASDEIKSMGRFLRIFSSRGHPAWFAPGA